MAVFEHIRAAVVQCMPVIDQPGIVVVHAIRKRQAGSDLITPGQCIDESSRLGG